MLHSAVNWCVITDMIKPTSPKGCAHTLLTLGVVAADIGSPSWEVTPNGRYKVSTIRQILGGGSHTPLKSGTLRGVPCDRSRDAARGKSVRSRDGSHDQSMRSRDQRNAHANAFM